MHEPKVRVFLYGSYMNAAVLREVAIVPERLEVTHAELARLYAHAENVLGERYLPHPVLVQTQNGAWLPALCYIAPSMAPRAPDPAYVDRILAPARDLGLPEWYMRRLELLRPAR